MRWALVLMLFPVAGCERAFWQSGPEPGPVRTASLAPGKAVIGASQVAGQIAEISGKQPPPRSLTKHEQKILAAVFENALQLDVVKVVQGGPNTVAAPGESPLPHPIGNTLYWPDKGYYAQLMIDGEITPAGERIFVHEMAHIAQFQCSGSDYIPISIKEQIPYMLKGQSRSKAYEWRRAADEGKVWAGLGVEQQAALIEDFFGEGVYRGRPCKADGVDRTAYVLSAVAEARAKRGWR